MGLMSSGKARRVTSIPPPSRAMIAAILWQKGTLPHDRWVFCNGSKDLAYQQAIVRLRLGGNERVVPYFQFTGGLSSNDIYRDLRQTQIGGPFEFVTNTEAGVRIRLHRGCALLIEGGYEHISNAHIYRRNDSFNGLGGRVGFSFSL